jgi:hypothetical protein
MWVASTDTTGAPEISPHWTLSVKRGRDGRSAFDIARSAGFHGTEREWLASLRGAKGDPGPSGRDLTHVLPDGQRY